MPAYLSLDAKNFFDTAIGEHGISIAELEKLTEKLEISRETVLQDWKSGHQGWLGIPDDKTSKSLIQSMAHFYSAQGIDTCIVIGIGGSDLGARAAYAALGPIKKGMRLLFAGGNTDPVELHRLIQQIDPMKSILTIISKSGDTVEPMASFLILREVFRKKLGEKKYRQHIVAITDSEQGTLNALANEQGYALLPLQQNIGGRFSVLTSVGLFPLACAGIDIQKIIRGAKEVRDAFVRQKALKNDACLYALLQYQADFYHGQCIHVLMPYSFQLIEMGKWFRQLWAESLGKKSHDADDEGVGPTPVAALGATDQHSQIQLYMEGPRDKTITFIEVKKFDQDISIPKEAKKIQSIAYLANLPLSKIIHAERAATASALTAVGRPNATLTLSTISPESIGALFMFFEIATAIAGRLYSVDPYTQPGVEAGKRAMYTLLGKAGYKK